MRFLVGCVSVAMGGYMLYDLFTDFGFFWLIIQLPLGLALLGIGLTSIIAAFSGEPS